MNYLLILLYLAVAVLLCLMGLSKRKPPINAAAPSEDRKYWDEMAKKLKKSYFVGAAGGLLAAIAIALKRPVPAEVGCITLLAALVFGLAILCRKVGFHPAPETERLQKKWKLLLLAASFGALFLTQLVFRYFLSL